MNCMPVSGIGRDKSIIPLTDASAQNPCFVQPEMFSNARWSRVGEVVGQHIGDAWRAVHRHQQAIDTHRHAGTGRQRWQRRQQARQTGRPT